MLGLSEFNRDTPSQCPLSPCASLSHLSFSPPRRVVLSFPCPGHIMFLIFWVITHFSPRPHTSSHADWLHHHTPFWKRIGSVFVKLFCSEGSPTTTRNFPFWLVHWHYSFNCPRFARCFLPRLLTMIMTSVRSCDRARNTSSSWGVVNSPDMWSRMLERGERGEQSIGVSTKGRFRADGVFSISNT